MTAPFLTVLTTPIPSDARRLYQRARSTIRPLVKPGAPLPRTSSYPGHYAVVRSVVEGLRAIEADFNFNPPRLADLARVVYAPANEALRQAIELKRLGRIDHLVAGPVNALFVDECDGIISAPEIDRLIIACEWARQFYEDAPALQPKLRVEPCGVDPDYWIPTGMSSSRQAVVYWKSGAESFCEQVEAIVRSRDLQPIRLVSRHGEHALFDQAAYRRCLSGSVVAVFLSSFETQGIALAEAWAMNVPTLVWDPRSDAEWRGRTFRSGSSCPYLTAQTGTSWRTLDELGPSLDRALTTTEPFEPRAWVLAHMTDAIRARSLYESIRSGVHMQD